MEYQSIGTIISSVLLLIGVLVAIYFKFDIVLFSLSYVLSGVSILCYVLIVYSQKFTLPTLKFNLSQWNALIKESWPFAITGISQSVYIWIDTIILSLIQGQEAVGFIMQPTNLF